MDKETLSGNGGSEWTAIHVPLFCPEVFRLFPGSEGVSGGVLEDVFGIGEVTGGAFAGVRNNCSAAYNIVALLLLEYFYHSFGYGIGQ